ncbi:MAG TPA: NAD-dependent epimerase/dehydratase family protein [Dermatophilaceae bacterium]|nr:NAD-dependent epimerase/dehydratase family protein [Dermatophilaceae bacterium]
MRVLVTGGAGFIGSHVTEALLAAGHDVVVLDALRDDIHRGEWPAYLPDVAKVNGDVRDDTALDQAMRGVDAVCHQAAKVGLGVDTQDLPGYAEDNVSGTAHLLAAMDRAGTGRLVLASSMVVYGEGGYACSAHGPVRPGPRREDALRAGRFEPPCPRCGARLSWRPVGEDAPLDPRNGYAATKVAQEHLASAWARGTGGTAVALRYHNVYGPRMPRDTPYAGVAAIFRSALAGGRSPRVFEDGGQLRDFVHVRDVAAANLAALSLDTQFIAVNIASGVPHTVLEMATALAKAMAGPAPEVTGQYRLGDVRHVVADPALARAGLGFVAAVGFAEGMAELALAPLR